MLDRDYTGVDLLLRAIEIGRGEGLRYLYAGNLPRRVGDFENTRCHECGELLIERHGFAVTRNRLGPAGKCVKCKTSIPGIWK
jgi:pyruvate formate lyase activating enzyme